MKILSFFVISGIFMVTPASSVREYYKGYALDIFSSAAKESISWRAPLEHLATLGVSLFPATYYDDSESATPDSLIVTKDNVEAVAKIWIQQKVIPIPKGPTAVRIENAFKQTFLRHLEVIDKLNQVLKCNAVLAVSTSPNDQRLGGASSGGTLCCEKPVILWRSLPLNFSGLSLDEQEEIIQILEKPYPQKTMEFIFAHEMIHIRHNDHLVLATLKMLASTATVFAWLYPFQRTSSPLPATGYAITGAFITQTLSHTASRIFSQFCERRADRKAMDLLETNEGAIACLQNLSKLEDSAFATKDYTHPPIKKRLETAHNFRPYCF